MSEKVCYSGKVVDVPWEVKRSPYDDGFVRWVVAVCLAPVLDIPLGEVLQWPIKVTGRQVVEEYGTEWCIEAEVQIPGGEPYRMVFYTDINTTFGLTFPRPAEGYIASEPLPCVFHLSGNIGQGGGGTMKLDHWSARRPLPAVQVAEAS